MKFDIVVGNPPFNNNTHLKILEKTIIHNLGWKAVIIHPSNWFFHKDRLFRKYKNVADHIESIYTISKVDSQHLFSVWVYGGLMVSVISPVVCSNQKIETFKMNIPRSEKFRLYHRKYREKKKKQLKIAKNCIFLHLNFDLSIFNRIFANVRSKDPKK